jgi:hypothetical protein
MLAVVVVGLHELLLEQHLLNGRGVEHLLGQLDVEVRGQAHEGAPDDHQPELTRGEHLVGHSQELRLQEVRDRGDLADKEEAPVDQDAEGAHDEGERVEVTRLKPQFVDN